MSYWYKTWTPGNQVVLLRNTSIPAPQSWQTASPPSIRYVVRKKLSTGVNKFITLLDQTANSPTSTLTFTFNTSVSYVFENEVVRKKSNFLTYFFWKVYYGILYTTSTVFYTNTENNVKVIYVGTLNGAIDLASTSAWFTLSVLIKNHMTNIT